jgi:hypothetical protein
MMASLRTDDKCGRLPGCHVIAAIMASNLSLAACRLPFDRRAQVVLKLKVNDYLVRTIL